MARPPRPSLPRARRSLLVFEEGRHGRVEGLVHIGEASFRPRFAASLAGARDAVDAPQRDRRRPRATGLSSDAFGDAHRFDVVGGGFEVVEGVCCSQARSLTCVALLGVPDRREDFVEVVKRAGGRPAWSIAVAVLATGLVITVITLTRRAFSRQHPPQPTSARTSAQPVMFRQSCAGK